MATVPVGKYLPAHLLVLHVFIAVSRVSQFGLIQIRMRVAWPESQVFEQVLHSCQEDIVPEAKKPTNSD